MFKSRTTPFPSGDTYEIVKIHWRNFKIFCSWTTNSNQAWHKASLGVEILRFSILNGQAFLQREIITKLQKYIHEIKIFSSRTTGPYSVLKSPSELLGQFLWWIRVRGVIIALLKFIHWCKLVSQVSYVAHGPLVERILMYLLTTSTCTCSL